jgi:hypothetical protein
MLVRHETHCPYRFFDTREKEPSDPSQERANAIERTEGDGLVDADFDETSLFDTESLPPEVFQQAKMFYREGLSGGVDVRRSELLYQQWLDNPQPVSYNAYHNRLNPPNRNKPHPSVDCNAHDDMPIEDEPVDFSDTFTEIETSPIDPNSIGNPSIIRGDWDEYLNTRKDVKYSNELAFQTHLLSTISSFRHVPMALYDRIMEVFFIWVIRGNLDFNRSYFYTSRNALMNNLKHIHNMQGFKSKLVPVKMQDGSTVGVVYFDVMEVAERMLHDKRLFRPENIAEGYDIWTGKGEPSELYSEIHTGIKWEEARSHYIGKDRNKFPLSLVAFYDETHTDGKEACKCSPLFVTISWLNLETRKKTYAQFPI